MQVGQAGGFGAAYVMMQSLGLLPLPEAAASKVRLAEGSGQGKRVVILGAGIAGMVATWELRKVGYGCTILEARGRAGGRNWTIRKGTRVEMTDGTTQTCSFEDGHYFNAGPARLPSQHVTMLGYCRELGGQLEVEVNSSRSSLLCRVPNYAAQTRPINQNDAQNKRARDLADRLLGIVRRPGSSSLRQLTGVIPTRFLRT